MIFKTFNNDINGIINKIGILSHTFGEVKNEFRLGGFSGVKDLYFGSITDSDVEKIREYNSLITAYQKGLPNGVSAQTAWNRTMLDASNSAKKLVEANNGAAISEENLAKATNTMSLSAKAGKIALQGLAIAGNMLAFMAITKLITSMYELTQVSKNVAQKAKDVSSEFSNTSSSINDYKSKIDDLYKTINDSNSSVEEVTNARKNLMTVQDELIDKFGDEREAVNLITDAINGQVNALDSLTQAQWQEAKNKFNDSGLLNNIGNFFGGYSDNIERMVDEYGNYTAKINISLFQGLSDENAEQYKEFRKALEEKFGAVTSEYEPNLLEISGSATEVYQKLLDIQNLASNLDFSDSSANHLTKLANSAKEVSDQYKDMWEQYTLYEKILPNKNTEQSYKNILDAANAYKKAFASGDENAINAAVESFSNIMEEATANLDDDSIIEFFNNMYPDIQAAIDKWEFKTKIIPEINTSELQGKSTSDIFKMLERDGLQKGEKEFNSILEKAIEYGLVVDESTEEIQKLIDFLVEWKILQSDISSEVSEPLALFSSFNGTEVGERLQYLNSQFEAGELTHKEYFDSLQAEIENVDFSSFTNSLKEANDASQQFFTDSVQKTASGLSDLINKFDSGKVSISEYLEGYLSIAQTMSVLTEELQKNSASWNQNGDSMSGAISESLDNAQSHLSGAIEIIQSYQDSIYSLEQIMSGAVEAGTNEFTAHASVIASDLYNIVRTGGEMADEVSNVLGTTTAEIAQSLTESVSNQSLASQAIAANTNTAIGNMAESIGTLFDNLGDAISNFKVDVSFGIKKISAQDVDMGILGTHKLPKIDFSLEANGKSLDAIGSAISSFGRTISSNLKPQMIELPDFSFGNTEAAKDSKYKPGSNITKNYDDVLEKIKEAEKESKKKSKEAEDTFEKTMDFFERRVEILTAAFANLEKGMENVFGAGAKNTLLSAQIGILDEEVNNYTDALAMYRKKASDALSGVDVDLRDKIVDGAVQITDFIGKGNEDVIEAMEAYQGWADKVSDCTQKLEELKTQIRQLELQKFNNIADDFADQFDLRDSGKDLFKKEIDLIEESNRVVSDSLYKAQIDQTQKQLEILHKEKTALADQMASALKSGNIDTGTDEWLEMVEKLSEVEGNILDCKTAIEEFNNEIKQLEVDKFDRIANHYNDLCDSLNSSNDLISKQIGLLEEAGELVGASYYTTQIDQLKKQLNLLDQEKKSLSDQLNTSVSSGIIKEGSEEWLEMMKTIQEVDGSILDCQTSIEEFDNAILNIHTNIFDRIQNQFSDLDSELSNLRGLFDDLEVSDEKGIWTKEGLAQLGLLAQQYELAEYRVQQYNDEINDLTTQYLAGRYSVTEYADKLSELTSAQWDAVNASENVKDAIIELNEVRINKEIEGIEKEIESFKELTDAQIKALDSAKALNDYQDSIAEKTKAVVDIERQLAAMQYDNSASTTAKRKQLEEQLAEAKKALTDAEYDHSIETQKDALNQQYEAFESERNAEIEALRLSLEQRKLLISESFANVKANTETIATEISEIATNHGITVSNTLMESWKSGENAIASYGETLTTNSSVFIQELLNVESGIYGLQTQADQSSQALANMFATQADNLINELNRSYDSENQLILESYHLQDALASMFGTRADNLINELVNSYYSEANLHAMTNTLQNSLVNTLERGYNINGITNALSSIADGANSVADAANKAAQALANMGAAQNTYAGVDSGKHGFHVYDSVTGELKDTIYSDTWNYADLMAKYNHQARGIRVQKFAKGGIVSKEKDSPLDSIAKAVGEDKLVAVQYGEGIINAEEMKKINKLSEVMAKIDSNLLNPSYIRPGIQPTIPEYVKTERPNITLHYDRMFEFNGDFNNSEQLLGQMKKVATSATTKILDEINRDFRIHGK